MNRVLISFLITTLAGLSTTIGYFVIYLKGNINRIISFFLSFASSLMVLISFFDLIPSAYKYLSKYYIIFRILIMALFFILGIILSSYLSYLISKRESNELKKVGFLSLISLVLHNIPEGIITFMASQINIKFGLSLALAIAIHNIPEGISMAIPLYYATYNKLKTFIMVFLAGISELLGGLITYIFLMPYLNYEILGFILILTSGIMINISLFHLLKESFSYEGKYAIYGFLFGILIFILSNYI